MLVLVGASLLPAAVPSAQKQGNSLDLVPADASFYGSSMRQKEQLEIITSSKAWAKLNALPAVVMVRQMAEAQLNQPGGPLDVVKDLMELPENQQLLSLIGDMFSNEMFVYGGKDWDPAVDVLTDAMNSTRYGSMLAAYKAQQRGEPDRDASARLMLHSLNDNIDKLRIPTTVIGFKITEAAPAQTQLKRLEVMAKLALKQAPPELRDRLKRTKVGNYEYLTLSLDGSLVPWDQVPWDQVEQEPGEFDKLKAKLGKMTLAISLGVQGDYALLSIAASNQHLAALGQGKLLGAAAELKPLAKYAKQRLTSVSYISKEMAARLATTRDDVDQLAALAHDLLPQAKLEPALQARILKDVDQLAKDVKPYIGEAGAQLSFSFLTPKGYEGYSYNWSENLQMDASKRLDLLDHVGGSPIAAAVARGKYSPEVYDLLVKWLRVGYSYVDQYALPQAKPEDQQKFKQVMAVAKPLLARLDKATRTMLIPALADGQVGIVLDAKSTSKQWHQQMPKTPQAMPMVELAFVFGVSDSKLLVGAFKEYKAIADDVVELIRKQDPNAVPPGFKLTVPQSSTSSDGTLYWYALPAQAGLDPKLTPNAGVGKSVAVLSLEPAHTARLLASAPLQAKNLAATKQPLAAAGFFDFNGFVDAATPWIEFGVQVVAPQLPLEPLLGGLPPNEKAADDDEPEARLPGGNGTFEGLEAATALKPAPAEEEADEDDEDDKPVAKPAVKPKAKPVIEDEDEDETPIKPKLTPKQDADEDDDEDDKPAKPAKPAVKPLKPALKPLTPKQDADEEEDEDDKPAKPTPKPLKPAQKPLIEDSADDDDMPAPNVRPGGDAKIKFVLEHTRVILDVLKVLRGVSSVTYLENGVTVTHTETIITDVK